MCVMLVIPQSGNSLEPDTGKQGNSEKQNFKRVWKKKVFAIDNNSLFHSLSACRKCQVCVFVSA